MKASRFYPQAKLMIRCIPAVAQETCFALKGGTAINLFVRDMPRLSVDVDLTYLPLEPRETALPNISSALQRISERIKKTVPGAKVQETRAKSTEARITKLVAALDRQHPRDIFDVKLLLENEGITDNIRKSFVVYLASHDRPIHELIEPTRKDISKLYKSDFVDMTEQEVSLEELIKVREQYITQIKTGFTSNEKQFLISLKQGQPDWNLLGVPNIENLPAVQWKLLNIRNMTAKKRDEQLGKLKRKLGV